MDLKNYQEMVDRYSGKYHQKLMKVCEPFFKTFGINYFFHQSNTPDGLYHGIGTHPDFLHFYFDQRQHECNPFITQFDQLKSGIYFYDSVCEKEFQKTMQNATDKYNLKHSLVLMEKDLDRCNQFGFSIPPDRVDIQSLVINELPLFKAFIQHFNHEMSDILQDLRRHPVSVRKDQQALEVKVLPEIQLDYFNRMSFLAKIRTPLNILRHRKLSKREIDCLKLYLKGKSAKNIGEKLGLSPRTVEFYLANIKNKLSCHTKPELISLLNHMGKLGLYSEIFE